MSGASCLGLPGVSLLALLLLLRLGFRCWLRPRPLSGGCDPDRASDQGSDHAPRATLQQGGVSNEHTREGTCTPTCCFLSLLDVNQCCGAGSRANGDSATWQPGVSMIIAPNTQWQGHGEQSMWYQQSVSNLLAGRWPHPSPFSARRSAPTSWHRSTNPHSSV
jgi:hypothetical protein